MPCVLPTSWIVSPALVTCGLISAPRSLCFAGADPHPRPLACHGHWVPSKAPMAAGGCGNLLTSLRPWRRQDVAKRAPTRDVIDRNFMICPLMHPKTLNSTLYISRFLKKLLSWMSDFQTPLSLCLIIAWPLFHMHFDPQFISHFHSLLSGFWTQGGDKGERRPEQALHVNLNCVTYSPPAWHSNNFISTPPGAKQPHIILCFLQPPGLTVKVTVCPGFCLWWSWFEPVLPV